MTLFSLGDRCPLSIDVTSVLFLIALYLDGRSAEAVCLLTAALLHECGHLLAAVLLHIRIKAISVSVLGASLTLTDPFLPYLREWVLCAAGPLASFLTAMAALCLPGWLGISSELPTLLASFSLGLGWLNLLPIGQLDGGRMFRTLCLSIFPLSTAAPIIGAVSFFFWTMLWSFSLYLLLKVGESLSLFVFCLSLFARFFLPAKSE